MGGFAYRFPRRLQNGRTRKRERTTRKRMLPTGHCHPDRAPSVSSTSNAHRSPLARHPYTRDPKNNSKNRHRLHARAALVRVVIPRNTSDARADVRVTQHARVHGCFFYARKRRGARAGREDLIELQGHAHWTSPPPPFGTLFSSFSPHGNTPRRAGARKWGSRQKERAAPRAFCAHPLSFSPSFALRPWYKGRG